MSNQDHHRSLDSNKGNDSSTALFASNLPYPNRVRKISRFQQGIKTVQQGLCLKQEQIAVNAYFSRSSEGPGRKAGFFRMSGWTTLLALNTHLSMLYRQDPITLPHAAPWAMALNTRVESTEGAP
jgi:hypothetical protein